LDIKDHDRLLMILEIYWFAFGYLSSTIVSKKIQDHITLQIQWEDQVLLISEVQSLASLYQKTFTLEKLFTDWGSQPLEALYYQWKSSKRSIDAVQVGDDEDDNHVGNDSQQQDLHNTWVRREKHYTVGQHIYFSPLQQSVDQYLLKGFDEL